MIHVTLYRGAFAPVPIRRDDFSTFAEFADSLEDLVDREYDDKREMLAWSPHRLADVDRRTDAELRRASAGHRDRHDGPYRHASNVEALTLLVIDVDRCTWEPLLTRVAELGANALVYTSPSDDPHGPEDARRARVIIEPDREILPSECEHTRKILAELLGLDPATSGVGGAIDAAKMFFAGRFRGAPRRQFVRFTLETT